MKQTTHASYIAWRFYLLICLMLLIVLGLIVRMLDLSVLKQRFLQSQGDARVLRTITTPAFRGMITDRDGYPLAISTSVFSIWMNPAEFSPTAQQVKSLSQTLAIKPSDIRSLLKRYADSDHEFAYLKRDV